jgi:hypothetical protein
MKKPRCSHSCGICIMMFTGSSCASAFHENGGSRGEAPCILNHGTRLWT